MAGVEWGAMSTLVLDPPPIELRALLERRRRLDQDRHDEMWEGVLHMVPAPGFGHAAVGAQVKSLLRGPAADAGLTVTDEFNLGSSEHDFRVPDGGLHRPGAGGAWLPTAALAIEIVSPGDETWAKLPFYAAHEVEELLIVDPASRSIDWLALSRGGGEDTAKPYRAVERSELIDLGVAELAQWIDWPPTE